MIWHPFVTHLWHMMDPVLIMVGVIMFMLLWKPTRWYTVAGILAFIIL